MAQRLISSQRSSCQDGVDPLDFDELTDEDDLVTVIYPINKSTNSSYCFRVENWVEMIRAEADKELYIWKVFEPVRYAPVFRIVIPWVQTSQNMLLRYSTFKLIPIGEHEIGSMGALRGEISSFHGTKYQLHKIVPVHRADFKTLGAQIEVKDDSSFIPNHDDFQKGHLYNEFRPYKNTIALFSKGGSFTEINMITGEPFYYFGTQGVVILGETDEEPMQDMEDEGKVWDEAQEIWVKEFRQNGKLEGERKTWYPNGQLYTREFWRDGKRDGESKEWHHNGQLQNDEFYRDGKLEGECKEWWDNGQLRRDEFYHHGLPEGESKAWHDNGQLWIHEFYDKGKLEGESKSWGDNGRPRTQRSYHNGRLEGESKVWDDDGQLRVQEFYHNGQLDGKRELWHDNGQIWIQEFYRNGEREGEYKEWDRQGRLKS